MNFGSVIQNFKDFKSRANFSKKCISISTEIPQGQMKRVTMKVILEISFTELLSLWVKIYEV